MWLARNTNRSTKNRSDSAKTLTDPTIENPVITIDGEQCGRLLNTRK